MIQDTIEKILKMKVTSFENRDYAQLVHEYFGKKIKLAYIKLRIEDDKVLVNTNFLTNEIRIEIDCAEKEALCNYIGNGEHGIYGSEQTIYIDYFKYLWRFLYSEKNDVLLVPCYSKGTSIYMVCIGDFLELRDEYKIDRLGCDNTILEEYPVLYFTLKHSLYNYYFDHKDIAWRVIFGCGNMEQSVKIINNIFQHFDLPGLELFQELANMPYEGQGNFGAIDFIDNFEDKINDYEVKFIDKCVVYKDQGRILRKYLQMSSKDSHLIATRYNAYEQANQCWIICGLGLANKGKLLCSVKFLGNSKWRCEFKNEIIMYNGTEYEISSEEKRKVSEEYEKEMVDYFDKESCEKIMRIIDKVKEQSHGTMLVVSEDAEMEAKRLGKIHRAIRIHDLDLTELDLKSFLRLTSIDGALVMNPKGICYSIGTILDGTADVYSNMGRGARYNSAYTYVYNMKKTKRKCAAVVVSEDGMVDVITTSNIENIDKDLYKEICESDMRILESDMERYSYDPRWEADCGLPF